jgi:5'-deoxynucleotidase YfbR-like HD superfamily hydrolase
MFLETVSGKKVNVLQPDPSQIDIEDIAWSLSRMPRFAGHTIPYMPYSVAQHSIQVMKDLGWDNLLMFHGLMHDSAEAYLGDIPSPIKHIPGFREEIKAIEDRLLRSVYDAVGVQYPDEEEQEEVHEADLAQRAIEAYNFMYSRGADWNLPKVSFRKLQEFEKPLTSIEAFELFLKSYHSLKERL